MALKRVNAVIVGAGAGGGIVAKELATAGMTVVLLERGKWHTAFESRKDDLCNQRTSQLGCAFGPDERSPRVAVDDAGKGRIVQPNDWAYSNNAACVGGGTFSYGAMAWRFMPQDFRMRSTYGAVDGSTLDDWPISYQDLEPYYEKAEWEIGVSGEAEPTVKAPRKKTSPYASTSGQQRTRSARSCSKTPRLTPVSHSHAAQYRALQRKWRMHALSLVRRFRLRSGCQERHAQHGDSESTRLRELRVAHRVHGERNPHGLTRSGHRYLVLRLRESPSGATG